MKRTKPIVLTLLLSFGCANDRVASQISVTGKQDGSVQQPTGEARVQQYPIGETRGVVVLADQYRKGDFIHIYNEDGTLWHKFTFDATEVPQHSKTDFKPVSFHQDYFVLAMKCVGNSKGYFEVVVNEETGLKKFVRTDDLVLKFQTWEEHILQLFAVDFNREDNPLLEKPGGQVKSIAFPGHVIFHPVEIKGDWLKVEWDGVEKTGGKNRPDNFGWIKWKKNGFLSIELFYFS